MLQADAWSNTTLFPTEGGRSPSRLPIQSSRREIVDFIATEPKSSSGEIPASSLMTKELERLSKLTGRAWWFVVNWPVHAPVGGAQSGAGGAKRQRASHARLLAPGPVETPRQCLGEASHVWLEEQGEMVTANLVELQVTNRQIPPAQKRISRSLTQPL